MGSTGSIKPLADTALFKPLQLGGIKLEHRVVLAPLTRMRSSKESDGVWAPNDLNVEYYSQRASKGGLLLSEATPISRLAAGYPGVPGIFTKGQVAAWKKVTEAVHAKGAFIYCQLWHVGRATIPSLLDGHRTVSSSDIPIKGKALDGSEYSDNPPKAMTEEDIVNIREEYAAAAKRAIEAGFDGVEIHGANGYLLDQFLHDNVNVRTDSYGGSIENRARFPLEVIKAVTAAIGPERTGIRLSPFNYFQDTKDSDPMTHWAYVCEQIAAQAAESRLAYVHMVEPRYDEVLSEEAKLESLGAGKTTVKAVGAGASMNKPEFSLVPFSKILHGAGINVLAAGHYKADNALAPVEAGHLDAVVFGKWFISNPDLPRRLAEGLELTQYDRSTFYGAATPSKGYTDYPSYSS
ncbi:MAG: hypothetical protein M1818_007670 [Claussenomyces sp. TS43310]|nr:MAG: hypothetical protein M1818_007670 [Claussenomyces sp. TS43310]